MATATIKRGGMDMAISAVRRLGADGRWLGTDEIVDAFGVKYPELHASWERPIVAVYSALYRANKRGDVEKRVANLDGETKAYWRLPQGGQIDVQETRKRRGYRAGGGSASDSIGYETPSESEKADLFAAQGGVCYLCGLAMRETLDAELDHIIARSRGGDTTVDGGNIALADAACNRVKGDKTLGEARTLIAAKRTVKTDTDAAMRAESAARKWSARAS